MHIIFCSPTIPLSLSVLAPRREGLMDMQQPYFVQGEYETLSSNESYVYRTTSAVDSPPSSLPSPSLPCVDVSQSRNPQYMHDVNMKTNSLWPPATTTTTRTIDPGSTSVYSPLIWPRSTSETVSYADSADLGYLDMDDGDWDSFGFTPAHTASPSPDPGDYPAAYRLHATPSNSDAVSGGNPSSSHGQQAHQQQTYPQLPHPYMQPPWTPPEFTHVPLAITPSGSIHGAEIMDAHPINSGMELHYPSEGTWSNKSKILPSLPGSDRYGSVVITGQQQQKQQQQQPLSSSGQQHQLGLQGLRKRRKQSNAQIPDTINFVVDPPRNTHANGGGHDHHHVQHQQKIQNGHSNGDSKGHGATVVGRSRESILEAVGQQFAEMDEAFAPTRSTSVSSSGGVLSNRSVQGRKMSSNKVPQERQTVIVLPSASLTKRGYHSPKVWESYKGTIGRLYLDERRSLKEVSEYMAQNYGFRAT
jgi:hypothetical protein